MGHGQTVRIDDDHIQNIGKSGGFFQQPLNLGPSPHHAHHPCSSPGFHGPDKGFAFFRRILDM